MTPHTLAAMTLTPARMIQPTLCFCLITLLVLADTTFVQAPAAAAAMPAAAPVASVSMSPWPEPAAPLDTRPIGPVESAGASANS
jgi:hypothetical protein